MKSIFLHFSDTLSNIPLIFEYGSFWVFFLIIIHKFWMIVYIPEKNLKKKKMSKTTYVAMSFWDSLNLCLVEICLILCPYALKRDKIHRKILLETDINTKNEIRCNLQEAIKELGKVKWWLLIPQFYPSLMLMINKFTYFCLSIFIV